MNGLLLAADEPVDAWPDIQTAIARHDGLVAVGGDLSLARLLSAYRHGIFPWYSEGQPICWWALHPRTVLWPSQLHVGRSLTKTMRNRPYLVSANLAFAEVMVACADTPRAGQDGTWITAAMQAAYQDLHQAGYAHSFEYWQATDGGGEALQLVGGLYGVQIGQVFFGESMFAHAADASKVAFVHAVRHLQQAGVALIDCQMDTPHLARFGASAMPFESFQAALTRYCAAALSQPVQAQVIHSTL